MSGTDAEWYARHATRLASEYGKIDPALMHLWLADLLPAEAAVVFDVGAGSGRDAEWLASLGHEVIAVEPSAAMRREAARLHPDTRLRWLDDSLPSLARATALGIGADAVLASAVWQHVAPGDRPRAFRKLVGLLRSGGLLAITLRNGPAEAGRTMYETSLAEVERLATAAGLATERVVHAADAADRAGVGWINVAFRLPHDGTGALPLLRYLILNDAISSTYKLGLLRCLCRAADASGGLAKQVGSEAVQIPLGVVALNWLRLYLPLVKAGLPQMPNNAGPGGLGFAGDGFRSLLAGMAGPSELRIGAVFSGDRAMTIHSALREAAGTIVEMPARFLTYPGGGTIFEASRGRPKPPGAGLVLDADYLLSLGTVTVPGDLWNAFRRFAVWVEPSLGFEWVRLMRSYARNAGRPFDDAVAFTSMAWSEPDRDVAASRKLADSLLQSGVGLRCVWTGTRLRSGAFDMDHCLPWSAWPCGDLWNLVPSTGDVNRNQKRDRLPSATALRAAGPAIRAWWSDAYVASGQAILDRFCQEAVASLPMLAMDADKVSLDAVFDGLELQRMRLRVDQRVPEWAPQATV